MVRIYIDLDQDIEKRSILAISDKLEEVIGTYFDLVDSGAKQIMITVEEVFPPVDICPTFK